MFSVIKCGKIIALFRLNRLNEMWRFLYTVLMYLIQPFVLLFMLLRSIKSPNYRKRLPERYGIYHKLTALQPNGIIIHAASVGEVIAATSLIKRSSKIIHIYQLQLQP